MKKLIIKIEVANPSTLKSSQYPPINLVVAIEDDMARVIQATPVTNVTLAIFESHFITPKAQKAELDKYILG